MGTHWAPLQRVPEAPHLCVQERRPLRPILYVRVGAVREEKLDDSDVAGVCRDDQGCLTLRKGNLANRSTRSVVSDTSDQRLTHLVRALTLAPFERMSATRVASPTRLLQKITR